jgi:iron complex outermembrane receptor protein
VNGVLDNGQPGLENDHNLKATPVKLTVSQPGNFLKETDLTSILSFSYAINKHLHFNLGFLNFNTKQDVAEHGFNSYATSDSVYLLYSTWNYKTVTNTLTNYFTYLVNTGKASHKLLLGYDYIGK